MRKSKLERHAQEILPGLWLGGRWACPYAREVGFRTICTLERPCVAHCFHAPILVIDSNGLTEEESGDLIRCDTHLLKRAHRAIDEFLKTGSVLVHCLAGRERSPLVVATWLCERRGLTLGEAYGLIKSKRPIVEERASWLSDAERNRYGTGHSTKDRVRVEL